MKSGEPVSRKKPVAMFADCVGYLTLLVIVAVVAFVESPDGSGYLMAGFIYLVLALAGREVWHRIGAPASVRQWLLLMGGTSLAGGAIFLFDGVIGHVSNSGMGFVDGALHTGPFGGALTGIATVGMLAVSIAGLVRSFFVSTPQDGASDSARSA